LKSKNRTQSTRGGPARELLACLLTLKNPRARFSRTEQRETLFSCLGETLWYFSGSERFDAIDYYIPGYRGFAGARDDAQVDDGAYGPRIFGADKRQIENVIEILLRKADSRQAVVQVFRAEDLQGGVTNVPYTCTLQFFARRGALHMLTNMRSNDAEHVVRQTSVRLYDDSGI
jgi:thymidylate synthase